MISFFLFFGDDRKIREVYTYYGGRPRKFDFIKQKYTLKYHKLPTYEINNRFIFIE